VRARVVKNKVAPPFRVAEIEILFKEGISKEGGILDLGTELGILRKSGSFFSFGDTRLGQGREAAREFMKQNPEVRDEVERAIRATSATKSGNLPAPAEGQETESQGHDEPVTLNDEQ